jgi:hypothetical protein
MANNMLFYLFTISFPHPLFYFGSFFFYQGGQGAIVGLAPVNHDLYKESHPKTHKVTVVAHKGDNLDRYLLGRQFMVILIVFTINLAGETHGHAELWGLPSWIVSIFLSGAVAMILFTNMVGQLNSEINACHCMLDYCKFFPVIIIVAVLEPSIYFLYD